MSCATEGAVCEVRIEYTNSALSCSGNNLKIVPSTQFTVTAFAHAEGYENSETVTATFDMMTASTGDINGDGQINIIDVITLVNMILGKNNRRPYQYNRDVVNVEALEKVTAADVKAEKNTILRE